MNSFSNRILFTVYGGLLLLSSYFIWSDYHRGLKQAEVATLDRLYSIAITLSTQISGDDLNVILENHPIKDSLEHQISDDYYHYNVSQLKHIKELNQLKTPIYTLVIDTLDRCFFIGLSSDGIDSYGFHYRSPPDKLFDVYYTGGKIPSYGDNHGTWLSAVYPIRDSLGKVISVIEVDYPFDEFIAEARFRLIKEMAVALFIFLLIGGLLYKALKGIINIEEEAMQTIESAYQLLEEKNEDILSSMRYARTIQQSLSPNKEAMNHFFKGSVVVDMPRDVVSGDFQWFAKIDENRAILLVADCTGHGVPGALMTIIGHGFMNQMVFEKGLCSPKEILSGLDESIQLTFKRKNGDESLFSQGMDAAVVLIDRAKRTLVFAGARRPLVIIDEAGHTLTKGVRRSIGDHANTAKVKFEEHEIAMGNAQWYYLFSDGITDQFGGEDDKKLMVRNLLQWLKKPSASCEKKMKQQVNNWKGDYPQTDDISLVGFRC